MYEHRAGYIRDVLQDHDLDAFLITSMPEIRWACGFTGSSGFLLATSTNLDLVTDGRYTEQASKEVVGAAVHIGHDALNVLTTLQHMSGNPCIGFDAKETSVELFQRLQTRFASVTWKALTDPLVGSLASKDDVEYELLQRAQSITDAVFAELIEIICAGMTEREVAAEIVHRQLIHGADDMSFPPIVASGPNSALPHARPTNRRLSRGDLVVIDFGCFLNGYASDMTRTIAIGTPPNDAREVYDVVFSAQQAAQKNARAGMRACDLDRIARDIIEDAGFGDAFTHSLGHGLGLHVHEWPRVARTASDLLPEHAVITIEPGVYLPGRFGVRIENAVRLNSDAPPDALPSSPTSLIIV